MSITLYTPATGYPDLELKIAYGLVRLGIEAFGHEKIAIENYNGLYSVEIGCDQKELSKLEKTFKLLCIRLLSSPTIPFSTPGITSRSAASICLKKNDLLNLELYQSHNYEAYNEKNESICRHSGNQVGNVIGFSVSGSFFNKRDGLDFQMQPKDPKDKTSPKFPRRPTDPRNICKTCALLSLLGTWYATFFFEIDDQKVLIIPNIKNRITGSSIIQIFALQHQIRKYWFNQKIPQKLIPLFFLSKVPSTADVLNGLDLFVAVLSRQQAYHVDGISLIPIENILHFLKMSPFNIATIDNMFRMNALESLLKLEEIIQYGKKEMIPSFARIYTTETSSKKSSWTNLLYSDTAFYLLREVAMIKQEIIENSSLGSLARTLRYFVRKRKYGYADDIRNAKKESRIFEETIAKLLREGRLRHKQKEKIHLPNEEEVKEVFKLANEYFEDTAKALVILAFSFSSKMKEEEPEINENFEEGKNA